jgi:hypothetical protein
MAITTIKIVLETFGLSQKLSSTFPMLAIFSSRSHIFSQSCKKYFRQKHISLKNLKVSKGSNVPKHVFHNVQPKSIHKAEERFLD